MTKLRAKPSSIPCAPESAEQTWLFQWAALAEARYPELARLYHIPNGGRRGKAEAARLKAEGVKPGVPDIHLPIARGKYHSLYIELKRQTGGTLRKDQRDWIEWLNAQGNFAEVCHGYESAVRVLEWYLNLKEVAQDE